MRLPAGAYQIMAGRAMNAKSPALIAALLLAAACSPHATPKADTPPPLAGAAIGGPFALVDQDGRAVTDRSFAGRYRIVYFGYTYCPDVCPVDMQHIGAAMKLLDTQAPGLAKRIVPIFVSVDPARDTPAVLKQFVSAFDPRVVGLTGTPEAVAKAAKGYAIYFRKGAVTPGGGYLMDHSTTTYLMDPAGKPLALLPTEGTPQAIADEIRRWAT